jgi:carbamoyltransferase
MAKTYIIGISAYYHDSAAALIELPDSAGGSSQTSLPLRILAAAQEERYSRKKFDERFPHRALSQVLSTSGVKYSEISAVVYYEKPWLTFERLLETYLAHAPKGLLSFLMALPRWLGGKLNMRSTIRKELLKFEPHLPVPPIYFSSHHLSHAASAFYPSPFSSAAVLCMDGVGEWTTTSAWVGRNQKLTPLWEMRFPHSLGLFYSAFTYFCGFKVNSGEYKLMGLAPYGTAQYVDLIRRELIDIKPDGTFRLNLSYFNFATGLTMTSPQFHQLFGANPRKENEPLRELDLDLAASAQKVTEEIILKLTRTLQLETGEKNLCLAGGVALNCVANGKVLQDAAFEKIWVQPSAGDAGGALGAAMAYAHLGHDCTRSETPSDRMRGSFLGNAYSERQISMALEALNAKFHKLTEEDILDHTARLLIEQKVVAWHQGSMEFGPRALGHRSILADARSPEMQKTVNLKIKFREGFRPFAPIVLSESAPQYFDLKQESPYMLIVAPVAEPRKKPQDPHLRGLERLKSPASDLPAITHVDYSARIQTVDVERNPQLHGLLKRFEAQTGCGVLLNTSFNVRGEPMVESPRDAFYCFMNTDLDALVIGPYLLLKSEQSSTLPVQDKNWKDRFELD